MSSNKKGKVDWPKDKNKYQSCDSWSKSWVEASIRVEPESPTLS